MRRKGGIFHLSAEAHFCERPY